MEKTVISRRKVRSLRVNVVSGVCWITWRGSRDIILSAGESFEVRGVEGFLLEFLKPGEVTLDEEGDGRTVKSCCPERISGLRVPSPRSSSVS